MSDAARSTDDDVRLRCLEDMLFRMRGKAETDFEALRRRMAHHEQTVAEWEALRVATAPDRPVAGQP